ncbi:MAG TPA: DUF2169 domain-containing protein [Thermohalobaculum sp.]|nr:DUF2169 domain-containing protein [Thermohalobaculum sp.]
MNLLNSTRMQAAYTMGQEPSAREHVVVVVKGTFDFPERAGDLCPLAAEQEPLVMADEYWGAPGFSAPRREIDFARVKPRCDVLVNGSAHAPGGRPAQRVTVGVKIGRWSKAFDVVGDRLWQGGLVTPSPSAPQPFLQKQITYDVAFGGVDALDPEEPSPLAYRPNPVGRGWHRQKNRGRVDGAPLPATEDPADPVRVPWGDYRPLALGVFGRSWPDRLRHAGTYDQDWVDRVFPFLPADFDDRYYQAAPADQWIEHPRGGEEVMLVNLTPDSRWRMRLPLLEVPVVFFRKRGGREERRAALDTVLIEPDRRRLMLTWRAGMPIRRSIFDFAEILVGHMPRGWWRARELGKTYYPSLGALVRSKREEADES